MQQLTPEAQQDFSLLMDALMPFAEEMLKKHGEFFPFGATVDAAGEVRAEALYDGDETPASEDVIAGLTEAFRGNANNGSIRATGICYDGRIVQDGKKIDSVIVSLEHMSGVASKAYIPYSKGFLGRYRFGEMSITLDDPKIFVAGQSR